MCDSKIALELEPRDIASSLSLTASVQTIWMNLLRPHVQCSLLASLQ